jgi:hypothetical protein
MPQLAKLARRAALTALPGEPTTPTTAPWPAFAATQKGQAKARAIACPAVGTPPGGAIPAKCLPVSASVAVVTTVEAPTVVGILRRVLNWRKVVVDLSVAGRLARLVLEAAAHVGARRRTRTRIVHGRRGGFRSGAADPHRLGPDRKPMPTTRQCSARQLPSLSLLSLLPLLPQLRRRPRRRPVRVANGDPRVRVGDRERENERRVVHNRTVLGGVIQSRYGATLLRRRRSSVGNRYPVRMTN